MSSAKKTEKSRKAKASVTHAVKARRTPAKAQKASHTKARTARTTASRSAAKASPRAATKTKSTAKAATPRNKSAAAKLRAAQARLKKHAAAAKAARPAAKGTSAKSSTAKSSAAKGKVKAIQSARSAKLNRSTVDSRGKSRAGRSTPSDLKVKNAAVIEKKPAAPQSGHTGVTKTVVPERRAQAAAVLALRSLQKPKQAAAAAARAHGANKSNVNQKITKKPEAAQLVAQSPTPAHPSPAAASPAKPPMAGGANPAASPDKAKVAKPAAPVKHGFKPLEFVVYPAHGVGQILAIEEQEVAGFKLELFVISFSKDKMILKVPTPKSISVGMRKLANAEVVNQALTTLTGRARIKRTMWSRRAQEYEAKINSGDLVAIAEVVRDLYRSEAQPEQSYSERQLYEAALDRVARELSAVQKLTETESLKVIETQLQKSPRRGKTEESEGDAEAEDVAEGEEGSIEEAA
jgi:CarD family transcriptional regulator